MAAITLKSRSKSVKLAQTSTDLGLEDTVGALRSGIAKQCKLNPNRLRLTVSDSSSAKPIVLLHDEKTIGSYLKGYKEKSPESIEILVKDLGPQIGWKTVFLIEYFGPLFIHPLLYFYEYKILGIESYEKSLTQKIALAMVLIHFLKRELETMFVHKFSLATMPLFNVFKNSFHYWGLSGFLLGFFIYAPSPSRLPVSLASLLGGYGEFIFFTKEYTSIFDARYYLYIFLFGEASNLSTHLTLARLRSDGSKERKIPYGYGFSLFSCPNYVFESLSWMGFSLFVGNWSSFLFLGVSTTQMFFWAEKKHANYIKQFGDTYPKDRYIYIPFVY